MASADTTRFAPARSDLQIASAWRVWAQGDEFYAAPRTYANVGRISFHKGYNWQYRLGTSTTRLAPPLVFSGGWQLALQLAFLVTDGVLLPKEQADKNVRLISIGSAEKLLVDILLNPMPSRLPLAPPRELAGEVLNRSKLRNGSALLVSYHRAMLVDTDYNLVKEMISKLRLQFTEAPDPTQVFLEAASCYFDPQGGNVIAIVPVTNTCMQVEPAT